MNHQGTKNTKKALCARTAAPLGDLGVLVVKSRSVDAEYVAAASWMAGRIEAGKRARFHHLEKALSRVLLMRPAGTECGAGFGYVEVSPSGEIHACHKAAGGAIGTATAFNKDSQDVQDSERQASCVSCPSLLNDVAVAVSERLRAPWLDNRWYSRRACRECWARNVCGGGCRAEALSHVGSVAEVWPVACAVKKAQVSAALYVAAACSREKLGAQLGARARQPRRRDIVAAGV